MEEVQLALYFSDRDYLYSWRNVVGRNIELHMVSTACILARMDHGTKGGEHNSVVVCSSNVNTALMTHHSKNNALNNAQFITIFYEGRVPVLSTGQSKQRKASRPKIPPIGFLLPAQIMPSDPKITTVFLSVIVTLKNNSPEGLFYGRHARSKRAVLHLHGHAVHQKLSAVHWNGETLTSNQEKLERAQCEFVPALCCP